MNETPAASRKPKCKAVTLSAGKPDHVAELKPENSDKEFSTICRNLLPTRRKHTLQHENKTGFNDKDSVAEKGRKAFIQNKNATPVDHEIEENEDFEILQTMPPSPPKRQKQKHETSSDFLLENCCEKHSLFNSLDTTKVRTEDDLSVETLEDMVLSDLSKTKVEECVHHSPTCEGILSKEVEGVLCKNANEESCASLTTEANRASSSINEVNEDINGDFGKEQKPIQFTSKDTNVQNAHDSHGQNDKNTESEGRIDSFRGDSSAYVQNLAEICYTVMNDKRWRIKSNMKQLFAWEYGDDLIAVQSLSSLYKSKSRTEKKRNNPCKCILCRDSSSSKTVPEYAEKSAATNEVAAIENDDEVENDCRAINLFCRLYYRKGPWFRLDDIFKRYYAPKLLKVNETEKDIVQEQDNNNEKSEMHIIDGIVFEKGIERLREMLRDIQLLCSKGLLRTFEDEQECGMISGSIGIGGNGILLSSDERQSVLKKLGGTTKKGVSRRDCKVSFGKENEILRQMHQQRSIISGMFSYHNDKKNKSVLPVRRHVDNEVMTKLLAAVVSSTTRGDYVPARIFRAKVAEVKKELNVILSDLDCSISKLDTSYKLREAPLLALRRCCRLYLCATCGPGDMRGDGKNGWKSVREFSVKDSTLPLTPPSSITWHSVTYPSLSYQFEISHFYFLEAYREVLSDDMSMENVVLEQVFSDLNHFKLWELSVEIRANVDYLCETNELILYQDRRKARGEYSNTACDVSSLLIREKSNQKEETSKLSVDFLNVLQKSTRRWLIHKFCSTIKTGTKSTVELLINDVESEINKVFSVCDEETCNGKGLGKIKFHTDCEKVLFVLAVLIMNILEFRLKHVTKEENICKVKHCWLRHMWWEGVLAYVLWDCIPILEKRQFYEIASKALEVLVFGSFQTNMRKSLCKTKIDAVNSWGNFKENCSFGHVIISRRARGKAIERLLIDYKHIFRQESKLLDKTKKKLDTCNYTKNIDILCTTILESVKKSSFISFSSVRGIAKKTKRPLDNLLGKDSCTEASLLGLRLQNDHDEIEKLDKKGYVDWIPKIDQTVAVTLKSLQPTIGTRCSYVGFEEGIADVSSLNVEELAMEYYATGRLPLVDNHLSGGSWVGWHDEGSRLRSLFRVLCACPILEMDGTCTSKSSKTMTEQCSVHLTRYQSAPFDLHVGSWNYFGNGENIQNVPGFYNRRKDIIDEFLVKLESLSAQDLSNCVFESIESMMLSSNSKAYNSILNRDIQNARSLSLLAAGFGGKMLSAAFRCMLFDYRHYSGGLPDLLLVRAYFSDSKETKREFVDLKEWIGEDFLKDRRLLVQEDDEFLGCSKVGDSGTSRSSNRWRNRQTGQDRRRRAEEPQQTLPEKLKLCYEGRPVQVQCLFVEVKSQNDRLDARQEDWLNVLDRVGDARVCKFVSDKQNAKKNRK